MPLYVNPCDPLYSRGNVNGLLTTFFITGFSGRKWVRFQQFVWCCVEQQFLITLKVLTSLSVLLSTIRLDVGGSSNVNVLLICHFLSSNRLQLTFQAELDNLLTTFSRSLISFLKLRPLRE